MGGGRVAGRRETHEKVDVAVCRGCGGGGGGRRGAGKGGERESGDGVEIECGGGGFFDGWKGGEMSGERAGGGGNFDALLSPPLDRALALGKRRTCTAAAYRGPCPHPPPLAYTCHA